MRFGATRPGVDRQNRVARVALAGEQQRHPKAVDGAFQCRQLRAEFPLDLRIAALLSQFQHGAEVVMPAFDVRPALQLTFNGGLLAGDAGRGMAMVPEVGLRGLMFEGVELRRQCREVKDAPGVRTPVRPSLSAD